MRRVRVAVAQLDAVLTDWQRNLAKIARVLEEHKDRDLIVFPEMMVTGYDVGASLIALCVHQEEWVRELQRLAAKWRTGLVVGMPRRAGDDFCNASVAIGPTGNTLAAYEKTHLYAGERELYKQGARFVTADLPVDTEEIRCGMEICYDLEFPEVSRCLAKSGARIICVSSANMMPWDWHHYIYARSRGMENQVFVLYANRVGEEGKIHFCGGSAIVSPRGAVLDSGDAASERVLKADLDIAEIERMAASSIPYWQDRREDLYPC